MNEICNRCGEPATLKLRQSVYSTHTYGTTLELDGNFCKTCAVLSIDTFRLKTVEYWAIQEEKYAAKLKEKELAVQAKKVGAELKE